MKTTVHLEKDHRLSVEPGNDGSIVITHQIRRALAGGWFTVHSGHLTADQAGALIFGMEAALEAMEVAQGREGAGA